MSDLLAAGYNTALMVAAMSLASKSQAVGEGNAVFDDDAMIAAKPLVRHESDSVRERSTCGWRHRLITEGDEDVAAWAHVVDLDGTKPHYHKRSTELYYVLEGAGSIFLDGEAHPIEKGSIVHIPPGVVHRAKGRMRVLVIGIPDIAADDIFFPEQNSM